MLRFLRFALVAALGSVTLTAPLSALEVGFDAPGMSKDLRQDLTQASLTSGLADGANVLDVLAAARADYARLVAELYDFGYYAPTVTILVDGREAATIDPISPPQAIRTIKIRVDTGPRFVFGTARVAPLAPATEVPQSFQPGATARVSALREAVDAGVKGWRAQGHAKAAPSGQSIIADHPKRVLNADITLAPGPRLSFGALRLQGTSAVRAERIRAIAGLPTGQVFSPSETERAAARLRRSGAFASVALSEAETIGPNSSLDITAQLADQKPRRFGFGGEVSSLEGLGLSGFWLHRNLLGGAERLRLEAEIKGIEGDSGGVDYRLSSRFNRPASWGSDTDFYLHGEVERRDEIAFSLDQALVEAGFRRYISKEREVSFGLGLKAARTSDVFGTRGYTIATLPLGALFDYRDDPLDAKRGVYAKLALTPFVGLSGIQSGLHSTADLRYYKSFGADAPVTLALRGQLGSLLGSSTANAPSDFLFYSGGGGTVRGQPYQSLAVDVGGGRVIGGRGFIGASTELRVKASDKIGVVGFFDAGYIGDEAIPDGSSGKWHSGAGLGLRYNTGFGPIRVDVATPTSGPKAGKSVQLYVGIGQSF